ncbi:MAG: A/G-specific adenine glycosylase [Xanthomonadales bacterium]|jgi:A/G-specific adenine glycosylase|nr:A/G-specific adenine glycosylase [Xanthomonadales bacterium]
MPTDTPPFAGRLLAWWDRHGRRDLPWQQPRTPYRVWVSEIMLQQTQVSTVIPYFERWMRRFPDLASLAAAPLDDVLALWSGLGYYARARNLHRAAQACAAQHGGKLPDSAAELAALPGIGPSTANAIVSQAQDRPAVVLDGNVRRWLARHSGTEGWPGTSAVQKTLWAEAEIRLPDRRGADYSQAVMDLGALVCTRTSPACDACPVAEDCQAFLLGKTGTLPSPKPAARVIEKRLFMLLMVDPENRVLLEKRPGAGIWGGLWCLPAAESSRELASITGLETTEMRELERFEHRLSHRRLQIQPLLAAPGRATQVKCTGETGWYDRRGRARLGLPRPVSKLLDRFENGEFK